MVRVRKISGKGYIVTDATEVIGVTINVERTPYNRVVRYKDNDTCVYLNDITTEICITDGLKEVIYRGLYYYHVEEDNVFVAMNIMVLEDGTVIKGLDGLTFINQLYPDEHSVKRHLCQKYLMYGDSIDIHILEEHFILWFNQKFAPSLLEYNESIFRGERFFDSTQGHVRKYYKDGKIYLEADNELISGYNVDTSDIGYITNSGDIYTDGMYGHYCIANDGGIFRRGFNHIYIREADAIVINGGIYVEGEFYTGDFAKQIWTDLYNTYFEDDSTDGEENLIDMDFNFGDIDFRYEFESEDGDVELEDDEDVVNPLPRLADVLGDYYTDYSKYDELAEVYSRKSVYIQGLDIIDGEYSVDFGKDDDEARDLYNNFFRKLYSKVQY